MNTYNTRTPIHGSRSPLALLPQLIFSTLFFLSMVVPQVSPLSFNFSSFSPNTPGMVFQNDSFPSSEGIQLTKNQTDSVGRAVYSQPLLLWNSSTGELADFITHFSFNISAVGNSSGGDGLAFFLSPFPSTVPNNSIGYSLGLFDSSVAFNKSANKLVAVEFDTVKNEWDPNSDHVGININSIVSDAIVSWDSSMKNGRRVNAWVSYNGSTENLSVSLTYADNPSFSGNSILSLKVDLSKILPEMVAIGFSAATGSWTELHTILSWDFSSTLEARKNFSSTLEVGKKNIKVGLVVGLSVGFGVLMAVVGLVWFIIWKKKASRSAKEEEEEDYEVKPGL